MLMNYAQTLAHDLYDMLEPDKRRRAAGLRQEQEPASVNTPNA